MKIHIPPIIIFIRTSWNFFLKKIYNQILCEPFTSEILTFKEKTNMCQTQKFLRKTTDEQYSEI